MKKEWECLNIQYVKEVFEKNKGKKIYCFGAGTMSKLLRHNLPVECKIDKYIDNNEQLWGQKIEGIEVCGPHILEEEKGYAVLITSRHNVVISDQLTTIGLKENEDYFDLYVVLSPYLRIEKFKSMANQFGDFVDRIPEKYFDSKPIKYEEKIGVVCILQLNKNLVNYLLAQALLLRSAGYKVSIILDSLKSYDSYCYAEGVEEVLRSYVDVLIEKIRKKCKDIHIYDITQEGKINLDCTDVSNIEKTNTQVLKWFDSRRMYDFLNAHSERSNISKGILENALGYIKAFFEKNKFDVISVYTGIHRHRSMYRYIAKKNQIRIATYDVGAPGRMLYNSDGVAAHADDITRIIRENKFSEKEKDILVCLAKNNFEVRKNSTVKDAGYNYQIVEYEERIQPFDVVIPLNIAWDAAALERDRIFEDYIIWLEKTLKYIIENTEATIMIREHPAQNKVKQYKYVNIEERIPFIKNNKNRIYFVKAADKINTYQYIEKCKVVLPYTSTTGLEAVMLGKNIIIHTNVYYADLEVGYKAKDEEDYYNHIQYYLNNIECDYNKMRNAYLAYYLQMLNALTCMFCTHYTNWMELSINQLVEMEGVSDIVNVIGEGVPVAYSKAMKMIESVKAK